MKKLKRLTSQMLAVLLAGTLTVGSLSVSAFGAEGDLGATSEVATEEVAEATEEVAEVASEDLTEYAEDEAVESDSADTEYSAEGSTEEEVTVVADTASTATDAVDTEAADAERHPSCIHHLKTFVAWRNDGLPRVDRDCSGPGYWFLDDICFGEQRRPECHRTILQFCLW